MSDWAEVGVKEVCSSIQLCMADVEHRYRAS